MSTLASGADIVGSLGGILAGLSELLLAIGAGIGFVIRGRRNARRERLRTETAAGLAAQEAKKQLETKLDKQHTEQIDAYKQQITDLHARQEGQIDDLQKSYDLQIEQFKQQVRDLTRDRETLLNRLLNSTENPKKEPKEPKSND